MRNSNVTILLQFYNITISVQLSAVAVYLRITQICSRKLWPLPTVVVVVGLMHRWPGRFV